MSSKRNVHPDFYKVAGRERPGHGVVQEQQRAKYTRSRVRETRDAAPADRPAPREGRR